MSSSSTSPLGANTPSANVQKQSASKHQHPAGANRPLSPVTALLVAFAVTVLVQFLFHMPIYSYLQKSSPKFYESYVRAPKEFDWFYMNLGPVVLVLGQYVLMRRMVKMCKADAAVTGFIFGATCALSQTLVTKGIMREWDNTFGMAVDTIAMGTASAFTGWLLADNTGCWEDEKRGSWRRNDPATVVPKTD